MIDGIRRKLKSIDYEDQWDANVDLQPEVEETKEIPTENAVLLAASRLRGEFSPDANGTDYYTGLIRAAIEHGGRYGGHQISLPWLRMILAGLEWRNIEPETAWDGVDATMLSKPVAQDPRFNDLFPSEGTPSGLETALGR
jgi:hypothetical protein